MVPATKVPPSGERVSFDSDTRYSARSQEITPTNVRIRLFALAALTVVFMVACALLAAPFLPAITWGLALAIIAWPVKRWISCRVTQPRLSAGLTSAVVVVSVVAPILWLSYHFVAEAGPIADQMQADSAEVGLRERLAEVPALNTIVTWMDRANIEIEAETLKIIQPYFRDTASLFHGSVAIGVQFLVGIIIMYFLFLDHAILLRGLRNLLPLSKAESDQVLAGVADSVHASLYANAGTSLIDAIGGGLMFWMVGLPAPVLWGVVIFVVSLLPMAGGALVWVPAVAFLTLKGQVFAAVALLVWGVLSLIIVDHILYIRMMGQGMRMHPVLALIGFLGGIAVFGITGIILGPAILAVTMAVLEVWKRRMTMTPPSSGTGEAVA